MSRSLLRMDVSPLRGSGRGDFRVLYASRSVTLFGTQATDVALLIQARQLTGSAFAVGLLGVAELIPLVVFGLYDGVLADRLDRRRLLRWCEAGLGLLAAALTANAVAPHPAVWPLYALAAMTLAYPNALIPFIAAGLHASWATGLLFAAPSAGALAVSATGGWLNRVHRYGRAIALAAAGWGLAITGLGLAPDLAVALGCLFAAGAPTWSAASSGTRCGIRPSRTSCAAGWPGWSCSATASGPQPGSCGAAGWPA